MNAMQGAHGRLWSLWEMLEFNAKLFYVASTAMAGTTQILEDHHKDEELPDGSLSIKFADPEVQKGLLNHAEALERSCAGLGVTVTLMAIKRLKEHLREGPVPYSLVAKDYRQIIDRFQDELTLTKLFSLNSKEQEYYEPQSPLFGAEFEKKFPTAALEVDEGAKCLALGRPTAAAFHLMRTMEVGIRATARCLGIPDPVRPGERNWGKILDSIKGGYEAKWPNSVNRTTGDGAFFESVYASLDAVKNPWRNATMHVEKTYSDDQAEHVFIVVKHFMKELSSRMDEDGNPKV